MGGILKNFLTTESGGSQTSSLSVGAFLTELTSVKGVKLQHAQRVLHPAPSESESPRDDWLLALFVLGQEIVVSMAMYAALSAYCTFRPRTKDLPATLRARGVELGKKFNMGEEITSWVLPGTIALAMQVLPREQTAWSSLGTGKTAERQRQWTDHMVSGDTPAARKVYTSSHGWVTLSSFVPWPRLTRLLVGGRIERGRNLPSPAK